MRKHEERKEAGSQSSQTEEKQDRLGNVKEVNTFEALAVKFVLFNNFLAPQRLGPSTSHATLPKSQFSWLASPLSFPNDTTATSMQEPVKISHCRPSVREGSAAFSGDQRARLEGKPGPVFT